MKLRQKIKVIVISISILFTTSVQDYCDKYVAMKWYSFDAPNPMCSIGVFSDYWANDSTLIQTTHSSYRGKALYMDTFKIVDEKWYYLLDSMYMPYFSKEGFEQGDTVRVYINSNSSINFPLAQGTHMAYLPYKSVVSDTGEIIYSYKSIEWGYDSFNSDFCDLIYFNPKIGIVGYYSFECGDIPRVDLN